MANYSLSDDQLMEIAKKIKMGMQQDSKLSSKQICEDVLEMIGVPTHTRDWICGSIF